MYLASLATFFFLSVVMVLSKPHPRLVVYLVKLYLRLHPPQFATQRVVRAMLTPRDVLLQPLLDCTSWGLDNVGSLTLGLFLEQTCQLLLVGLKQPPPPL